MRSGSRFHLPRGGPALFALVMGGALVLGLVAGIASALLSGTGVGTVPAAAITGTIAMAAVSLLVIWWWRRLDEAAREAHKWSWFWGGNLGLVVGGVILLTLVRVDLRASTLAGVDPAQVLALGMALLLLLQLIGYTLAWAGWWLARR